MGRPADAARFGQLATNLSAAFLHRFWDPNAAVLGSGSQCSSAMPLAVGMLAGVGTRVRSDPHVETAGDASNTAPCVGTITVQQATYGAVCGAPAGNANQFINGTCNGREECVIYLDSHQLGDPCPNKPKDFRVLYSCNGQCNRNTTVAAEASGHAVRLDCSGVVPPAQPTAAAVLAQLVLDIEQRGMHQTGGDIGHRFVLLGLRNANRSDVVQALTLKEDYPSYGYLLGLGATSLPEQWDGQGSQLHSMLGHVEEWFYSGLAGLQLDLSAGCTSSHALTIAPYAAGPLEWVQAHHDAPCGRVAVQWWLTSSSLTVETSVAPGFAEALVLLRPPPAYQQVLCRVYMCPVAQALPQQCEALTTNLVGVVSVLNEPGLVTVRVLSGTFVFVLHLDS